MSGGNKTSKDVNNYQPPCGPKNINDPQSPGLHGKNHGIVNGPDSPVPKAAAQASGAPTTAAAAHRGATNDRKKVDMSIVRCKPSAHAPTVTAAEPRLNGSQRGIQANIIYDSFRRRLLRMALGPSRSKPSP